MKRTAAILSDLPIVESVELFRDGLITRYTDGITERYLYTQSKNRGWYVTENEAKISKKVLDQNSMPLICPQARDDRYRYLRRHVAYTLTVLEYRIRFHQIIQHLMEHNGQPYDMPPEFLEPHIEKIRATDLSEFTQPDSFVLGRRYDPSTTIVWLNQWCNPSILAPKDFRRFACKRLRNLSSIQLLYLAEIRHQKFFHPLGFAALLRYLGVKSVIDADPSGAKMFACALAKCEYIAKPSPAIDYILGRGGISAFAFKYQPYNENSKADLLIADGGMGHFDISAAKPFMKQAEHVLSCCYSYETQSVVEKYNPTIINTRTKCYHMLYW